MDHGKRTTKAAPPRPTKPSHISAPTLSERKSKSATEMNVATGTESDFASENSAEGQNSTESSAEEQPSTENSEDESKPRSHKTPAANITNKSRRHKAAPTKILNRAPTQDSQLRPVEGASSIFGSYDRHVPRRRKTSNTKIRGQKAVKDSHSQASLLLKIANDVLGLIETTPRLLRTFYPILKWIILGYFIWMATSYCVAALYSYATTALAPMCAIPIFGPQLPFCMEPTEPQAINASKVATSQEGLTVVMDRVGQNFDLARDMVDHEFAVRDLRIRVGASNLSRKKELVRELESLTRYTKQTAKGLSRFTAKVGKSIDTVKIFDDYAVKALEGIAEQQYRRTLPDRVLSAISPLAAFKSSDIDYTEEKVKKLFIKTAMKISDKVKLLIDESFDLGHNLDLIQETLNQIRELTVDESGDVPQKDVLGALWTRLARPDDYSEYKSHTSLLTEMTEFYESSTSVMKETIAALNHVDAELSEFREDFATPALILKDDPLEVIVALLRKSAERLEAGKMKLEHIEQGARPRIDPTSKSNTKTVHVKMG